MATSYQVKVATVTAPVLLKMLKLVQPVMLLQFLSLRAQFLKIAISSLLRVVISAHKALVAYSDRLFWEKVMRTATFGEEHMDRISNLPDHLIENILLCLPLLDLVRTSVLSTDWQYKWLLLPKLVFDSAFYSAICKINEVCQLVYPHIVTSLLLQHTGYLEELYLVIPDLKFPGKEYINNSIRIILSRGVTKLSILNSGPGLHILPFSLVPSPNLTQLELSNCIFNPQSLFRGFQNLISLRFDGVRCHPETLLRMTANCPKLQRIILHNLQYEGQILSIQAPELRYLYVRGNFQFIHLQVGQNLTEMELHLERMDTYPEGDEAYLNGFFGSLVSLKSLILGRRMYKLFMAACHLRKLPRKLDKLKILRFGGVDFNNLEVLRYVMCLINSSPNLQTLEIICYPPSLKEPERKLQLEEKYKHCSLQSLNKVHFGPFIGTKIEMEVIRFLLRHSRTLSLMRIWHEDTLTKRRKSKISKKFKRIHRASRHLKFRHSNNYSNPC